MRRNKKPSLVKPVKFDYKPLPADAPGRNDHIFRNCLIGCGAIIIIPMIVVAIAVANNDGTSSTSSGEYEAIAQCEARIENLLKSPATADFNTGASGAGNSWTVSGTVDSENGFGALVRSNFQCSVTLTGDTATTTVNYLE